MFGATERDRRISVLEQEIVSLKSTLQDGLAHLRHEFREHADTFNRERAQDAEAYRHDYARLQQESREELVTLSDHLEACKERLDQLSTSLSAHSGIVEQVSVEAASQQSDLADLKLALRGLENQVRLGAEENAKAITALLERINQAYLVNCRSSEAGL